MKKCVIVLVLTALLLSISPVAYASSARSSFKEKSVGQRENVVDEEIRFRGISFGTRFEDVKVALKNDGIIIPELGSPYQEGVSFHWGGNDYARDGRQPRLFFELYDNTLSVAGYTVWLDLWFICLDKNGKKEVDPEDCVFIYAEYDVRDEKMNDSAESIFNRKSFWNRTYNDLSYKLKSLYGNPMSSSSDSYTDSISQSTSWTDEHSSITLDGSFYNTDGSCWITIKYKWNDGFEMLNTISENSKAGTTLKPNNSGL